MHGRNIALQVAVLLLLALPAAPTRAGFTDPLPDLAVAVTAAGAGPGLHVAGHAGGQVVAIDATTDVNLWSVNVGGPVRDLAVASDLVLVAQGPNVIALRSANGTVAWQHVASAFIVAVDGPGWAATADGRILGLSAAGAVAAEQATGLAALADVDVRDGRWAAVGPAGLVVQDGAGTLRADGSFQRVRWTGPDTGLAVDAAGHLQHFTVGAAVALQAAALTATVTALDGADGSAVAGDAGGLLYALDATGTPRFGGLATYANSVLDVALWEGDAVAAFRGGWLGTLRLEPAAVGLLLSPSEGDVVPNPFLVRWAYADPDAEAGDRVRHRIAIRAPGGSWQVVASGFSDVDPLTRLREQAVDLAAVPSGSPFDLRLELVDADGRLRITGLGRSLILDSEPPQPVGQTLPAAGERVTSARPVVGLGHRDRHSGVLGQLTEILLDGEVGRVDWESNPSFTTFTPSANLTDGLHTWQATVQDRAGNRLVRAGSFVVDTTLPVPGEPVVETFLDALLLRFGTPEPAACQAATGSAGAEDALSLSHVLVLTGLAPDTAYPVRLTCRDGAGSTATRDVTLRTRPGAPSEGVRLEVAIEPARPQGAAGYYTTTPRVTAEVLPSTATVDWSLDGAAPGPLPDPATVPDGAHNVLVLARSGDGSATARSLRLAVDSSPPPPPTLTLDAAKRLVSWPAVTDLHSGVAGLRLEGLVDGEWVTVLDLPAVAREAAGLPVEASAVRLVARNGAGLESTSAEVALPMHASDLIHTAATLQARQVAAGDLVRVRLRLAPPDQSAEVVLVDANGVQRTFSDRIGVGTRLFEYSAPASAFRPGVYDVRVRLSPSGTELGLGALELVPVDGDGGSVDPGAGRATRDSPGAAALVVLAALAAAGAIQRRRA